MTSSHASGESGRCLPIASSTLSLPRSCKIRIAVAVNILVIDPSRNFVSGVFGTSCSAFASP